MHGKPVQGYAVGSGSIIELIRLGIEVLLQRTSALMAQGFRGFAGVHRTMGWTRTTWALADEDKHQVDHLRLCRVK